MSILLQVLSLFLVATASPPSPGKVNLKVEIQNLRVAKGIIYVSLFRPSKEFPQGKALEGKNVEVTARVAQITFSVDPGEYAIAVYHDENSNGKMDKRVFGIPKEPYGFSNNYRPVMSAPKFSDCRFNVGEVGKTISIKLI